MSANGRHDPVVELIIGAADADDRGPVDDDQYEMLLELDRLEELLEAMTDLGVTTRAAVEELPVSPTAAEVIAELRALGYEDSAAIEARLAELSATLDDD